jgi:hypothetical protein
LAPGTVVVIEVMESISTATHRRGDKFALRLAQPLLLDGAIAIPAGTPGEGEVIDAHKPGMAGKPGELVLAARRLDLPGGPAALRGFKVTGMGQKHELLAMALVAVAGPAGMVGALVTGGDAEIPAGTLANAKLAAELDLGPPPANSPSPSEQKAISP